MLTFMIVIFVLMVVLFSIGAYINSEELLGGSLLGLPLLFLCTMFSFFSYMSHSSDLGTVRAQNGVVKVYQDKIERLNKRLDNFNFPRGSLLNADSPVASIVTSLTDAENDLAKAKATKAEAIRSIAQRDAGPFKFIVDWNGKE